MTRMRSDETKRLIVVLGMHRSGTSAITRALVATGAELGDRLGPPGADNEMGYWEDLDIYRLNVELLAALGRDWQTLAPLEPARLASDVTVPFRVRAAALLREKTAAHACFAMKDPRIAVLLPFWNDVFQQLDLDVRFVLASRNPMSVVQSLQARNGFAAEKSYYLWLEHVVASVVESTGRPRAVVDYDLLIDHPEHELRRVGSQLSLQVDDVAVEKLGEEFLQERFRHSRFTPVELASADSVPPEVKKAFVLLDGCARDDYSLEQPDVVAGFRELEGRLADLAPALSYMSDIDTKIAALRAANGELERGLSERDARLTELEPAFAESEKSVAAKTRQISTLRSALAESHAQTASLLEANNRRVAGLMAEHARTFALVKSERDDQIVALTRQVHEVGAQLEEVVSSTSWRATEPVRVVGRSLRGIGSRAARLVGNLREND